MSQDRNSNSNNKRSQVRRLESRTRDDEAGRLDHGVNGRGHRGRPPSSGWGLLFGSQSGQRAVSNVAKRDAQPAEQAFAQPAPPGRHAATTGTAATAHAQPGLGRFEAFPSYNSLSFLLGELVFCVCSLSNDEICYKLEQCPNTQASQHEPGDNRFRCFRSVRCRPSRRVNSYYIVPSPLHPEIVPPRNLVTSRQPGNTAMLDRAWVPVHCGGSFAKSRFPVCPACTHLHAFSICRCAQVRTWTFTPRPCLSSIFPTSSRASQFLAVPWSQHLVYSVDCPSSGAWTSSWHPFHLLALSDIPNLCSIPPTRRRPHSSIII